MLTRFSAFILYLSSYYLNFEVIACHIISQGFVNAIPDYEQETESGSDGKFEVGGSDPGGMGEGDTTGAADVGDQIENLEQIEGLKVWIYIIIFDDNFFKGDEREQEGEGADDQPSKMPDVDTPIDVDDNFTANLENLDDGETDIFDDEDQNKGENGENDEVENIEWNVGDVERPEEEQLDPKLWDQEDQNKKEESNNNPEGFILEN